MKTPVLPSQICSFTVERISLKRFCPAAPRAPANFLPTATVSSNVPPAWFPGKGGGMGGGLCGIGGGICGRGGGTVRGAFKLFIKAFQFGFTRYLGGREKRLQEKKHSPMRHE